LPVEAQERIVGRTKLSDIELDDSTKPADSHVALTTITGADGTEREILRDNMPFGTVGRGEFGTYFIGYARTPKVTEAMLERMFLGTQDAAHDRILDFSTPVTGCLFHVPTADFLDDLPAMPAPPGVRSGALGADVHTVVAKHESQPRSSDTSLRIGSMKRSASR
jgi:putative iron-dependent peroxidase